MDGLRFPQKLAPGPATIQPRNSWLPKVADEPSPFVKDHKHIDYNRLPPCGEKPHGSVLPDPHPPGSRKHTTRPLEAMAGSARYAIDVAKRSRILYKLEQ